MKKILFAAVALVAMASCATEDVISRPDNNVAIEFNEAFVENSTRANDIAKANLSQFNVYGSVNANNTNGFIFDDKLVEKSGDAYTYTPAQYWIPAADYKFTAFGSLSAEQVKANVARQWSFAKGADAANGTISFNNKNAQANQDLVYAYAKRTTPESIDSKPDAVAFTFNHMLSRVKFTIANGFTAGSNIKLDITNLTITDAHADGTLAIENGEAKTWAVGTETFSRNFGSTTQLADNNTAWTTEHFYLIPTKATYNVTFSVTLWQAGVEVDTYARTAVVTLDMEKGMSYNIKAALDPSNTSDDGSEIYPIEFTVEGVNDWAEFGDVEATVPEHTAANAAELAAAVAEGGVIALTDDINLDELPATLANERYAGLTISKNTVIDGAGHTVSSSAIRAINVAGDAKLDVTIKNLNVEAEGERAINVELCKSVTLDNVTASATHYALNLVGAADNVTVVANNCNFNGLSVVNVWGENAKVTLNDSVLNLVDDEASEGYAAIQINDGAYNSVVTVKGGKINITGSANDSCGGVVIASGASIIFNGTEGTTTIEGQPFVINYDNGYTYSFSTLAEAVETAKDGETIVMTQNATITEPVVITKEVIVDLNGKNLAADLFLYPGNTVEEDSYAFWVKNGGELTINGEGEISTAACKYSITVWAQGGKVTINGGTFKNAGEGSDLIYASANGHVVINGGEFVACKKQAGVDGTLEAYSVLNLKGDNTGSSITCYGGRYFKFDPANNKSENPAVSFVADGYQSVVDGDYFKVIAK